MDTLQSHVLNKTSKQRICIKDFFIIKLLNDSVQHYNRYRMTENRKETVYQEHKNTRTALTDESAIRVTMMFNYFLLHRRLEMICQHSLIPNSSENLCDHILDTSGTDSKVVTLLYFLTIFFTICFTLLAFITLSQTTKGNC